MAVSLLDHADLDNYSRFAGRMIFQQFPSWPASTTIERDEAKRNSYLKCLIPCPNPFVERGLTITTCDNELTVYFHTTHCHFTNWGHPLDANEVTAGLEAAAGILADEIGCATYYGKNRCYGDSLISLPAVGPIDVPFLTTPVTRVIVRSWSGRFDRDEPRRPPSWLFRVFHQLVKWIGR